MFATRSLTIAAAAAGCVAITAAAAPTASADLVPTESVTSSYFMGDTLNCFVDARLSIEADAAIGGRPVVYVEPLGIRSTVPGVAAPATCSATLFTVWNDEQNPSPRAGTLRVDAAQSGSARARLELEVQPESDWTVVSFTPQAALIASYGATSAPPPGVLLGTYPR
ncbi:hypothetical protein AB0H58_08180 [Nocardia neocaledoniensis]|uniref:hypothetical protein n=1 Tax=Nocardia neocaledoniensis TaxID=236511 RepID=UPI0033D63546